MHDEQISININVDKTHKEVFKYVLKHYFLSYSVDP